MSVACIQRPGKLWPKTLYNHRILGCSLPVCTGQMSLARQGQVSYLEIWYKQIVNGGATYPKGSGNLT